MRLVILTVFIYSALAFPLAINAQINRTEFKLGQYIQKNSDTSLLFVGNLLFTKDSIFRYKSTGKLTDDATGFFKVSKDTLILNYNDGYNESTFLAYEKNDKPFPIELLGMRITQQARPLKLLLRQDYLIFIAKNQAELQKGGFYYVLKP